MLYVVRRIKRIVRNVRATPTAAPAITIHICPSSVRSKLFVAVYDWRWCVASTTTNSNRTKINWKRSARDARGVTPTTPTLPFTGKIVHHHPILYQLARQPGSWTCFYHHFNLISFVAAGSVANEFWVNQQGHQQRSKNHNKSVGHDGPRANTNTHHEVSLIPDDDRIFPFFSLTDSNSFCRFST